MNTHTTAIKQTIQALIEAGTSYNIEALERIYHDTLEVIMIDEKEHVMIANKTTFKQLFKDKKVNGDAPLNTWANFNHVQGDEHKGHVLVTRKVNLTGTENQLVLSIDLVYEDNRWQVIREVIFSKPH